jgi:Ran GTPase-activating protein (RanGAP) involved in mRNA processing and transport
LVEELWLGPVFEDSETILSAIRILPSTVKFLDLDLRNALHLLPQALPLLLRKTHITTLSVRFFGDAGAIELAKWVHLNPNLERLNLQGNRIGSLGARTLVDAIIASGHHRRSLRHLNLSCNCILHGDLIGQLLALSTSLESVDVQFNWLGDQDVVDICQGLRKNKSVRELSLYGCQRITKAGVTTIMKCLEEHNTSLHDVKVQALDDESDTLVQRISYWTDLNKAGRYLIQSSPDTLSKTKSMMTSQFSASSTGRQIDSTDSTIPSGLWPLALEKSKDQPNALYYLLRHGSPKILNSS